jgi:hypothetical protein
MSQSKQRAPSESSTLPPETKRRRRIARLLIGAPLVILTFGACGDGAPRGALVVDSIPECDAYESAYRACTAHLGARATAATDRHVAGLRNDVAAAVLDPRERERRRESCVAGTAALDKACR